MMDNSKAAEEPQRHFSQNMDLIESAGVFIYPLAACSIVALTIMIERLIALRNGAVLPRVMVEGFISGEIDAIESDRNSVAGRIVDFFRDRKPNPEGLKAFAKLEVTRMERGLFLLEIVVGAAPLIGLLGTVTGLMQTFGDISPSGGLSVTQADGFVRGIAVALTTTVLGLSIAIPALVAHSYLIRRVESLAARINVGVEVLIEFASERNPGPGLR